jgi:threonine dehydrogenase-like Zn-dependent dehydrogenase
LETALNAHWDAETKSGERVLVVGAGVVGLLTAYLAKRFAGADVAILDTDERKAPLADALGISFASPRQIPRNCNVVFHASATAAGLQSAIDAAGEEGLIVEMSWYGDQPVTVSLGGAFHALRLKVISSQVGKVAPARRKTHTPRQRLTAALALLDDPVLDALAAEERPFEDMAGALPQLLTDQQPLLLPVISYCD